MKEYRDWKIIGVDTGYGNVKTANCCFPAGLSAHSAEPAFKDDLLNARSEERFSRNAESQRSRMIF